MTALPLFRFAAGPAILALALGALAGCERRPATPPTPSTSLGGAPQAAAAHRQALHAGRAVPRLSEQSDN